MLSSMLITGDLMFQLPFLKYLAFLEMKMMTSVVCQHGTWSPSTQKRAELIRYQLCVVDI